MLLKTISPLIEANLFAEKPVTPILLGEPGIGKTATANDLARKYKTKVFTLQINQIDTPTDLLGIRPRKEEDGRVVQGTYPHVEIASAIQYAKKNPDKPVFLVLDEINRTRPSVTSACLTLITARKIGEDRLPDNIKLIATGNDKGNINALDDASVTRMVLYKVEPDLNTFFSHVQDINPYVKETLDQQDTLTAETLDPDKIFNEEEDDDEDNEFDDFVSSTLSSGIVQKTNPRTIEQLSMSLNQLGLTGKMKEEEITLLTDMVYTPSQQGDYPLLYEYLASHTGHTAFTVDLYKTIQKAYEDRQNQGGSKQTTNLDEIKPSQDFINEINSDQTREDIKHLLKQEDNKGQVFIWLLTEPAVKEVDHALNVENTLDLLINDPDLTIDKKAATALNKALSEDLIDTDVTEKVLKDNPFSEFNKQYGGLLTSMLGLELYD